MKSIVFFISIIVTTSIFAQKLDLIVTNNGDSLACKIDSLNNDAIFIKLKQNGRWVNTFVEKNKAQEVKYDNIDKKAYLYKSGTSIIIGKKEPSDLSTQNPFGFRHNFGPSSHNLKKGEGCYTTWCLMVHEVHYAPGDKLTLAAGTSIVGIPFYVMANYTIYSAPKSSFAAGDLFLCSPVEGLEFYGNLLYGMYTRGSEQRNFSVGAGLWTIKDDSQGFGIGIKSPAFCISAQLKTFSDNWYFITENYTFRLDVEDNAALFSPERDFIRDEYFTEHHNVAFGLSGFRYISKRNQNLSWNLSMIYIFSYIEGPPDKYLDEQWSVEKDSRTVGFIFPALSFSWKFGHKK